MIPTFQALQYALTDWDGYSADFNYVGADNFVRVLTADEATLPAESRIVTLTGNVRARSTPPGSRDPLQLEAAELSYDMEKQEVFTDGEVQFTSGGISVRGRGLRVDITEGTVRLESGTDATISL